MNVQDHEECSRRACVCVCAGTRSFESRTHVVEDSSLYREKRDVFKSKPEGIEGYDWEALESLDYKITAAGTVS